MGFNLRSSKGFKRSHSSAAACRPSWALPQACVARRFHLAFPSVPDYSSHHFGWPNGMIWYGVRNQHEQAESVPANATPLERRRQRPPN